MTKTQKGFTLIELLVVIAIIGILAGILFVAINPKAQTDKATTAQVKSAMASVRTQAALVFSQNDNGYTTVCTNDAVVNLVKSAQKNEPTTPLADTICKSVEGSWAATGQVIGTDGVQDDIWCIDSEGYTGAATGIETTSSGVVKCNTA